MRSVWSPPVLTCRGEDDEAEKVLGNVRGLLVRKAIGEVVLEVVLEAGPAYPLAVEVV